MSVPEKDKVTPETQKGVSEKSSDKGIGKKPIETRDLTKQNNPYAKPIVGKCYRWLQPTGSSVQ